MENKKLLTIDEENLKLMIKKIIKKLNIEGGKDE